LESEGLYEVEIEHVRGNLSDHYNPVSKVLALSDAVYASNSVAAIGVAAHECGHAVQHAKGYVPLVVRNAVVPVARFGSGISWILIMIGLFIQSDSAQLIINLGIIFFSVAVLLQLLVLTVEFNASKRAITTLRERGYLQNEELKYTKKVLSAAAMTYVAAAAASILQLLRLILLFGGRRRD
jgi:Zn-dependent membrane protease YugP